MCHLVAVCLPPPQSKRADLLLHPKRSQLVTKATLLPPRHTRPCWGQSLKENSILCPPNLSPSREKPEVWALRVERSCSLLTPKSDISTWFRHRRKRARQGDGESRKIMIGTQTQRCCGGLQKAHGQRCIAPGLCNLITHSKRIYRAPPSSWQREDLGRPCGLWAPLHLE